MVKKALIIGLVVTLAVFLAGGVYIATQKAVEKPVVAGTNTNVSDEITVRVGEFEKKVGYVEGMTALEVTKIATNSEVVAQGEGTEAYVLEILGQSLDKREFWEFLINDQTALVGAGSYKVKSGDKIEWKISKF